MPTVADSRRVPAKWNLVAAAALACAGLADLFLIGNVLPAPIFILWIAEVIGTEFSLWLGALAVMGAALGALAVRRGAARTGRAAVILGVIGGTLALVPPLSSLPVARRDGVHLSLSRYVFGQAPADNGDGIVPLTTVYAQPDGKPLHMDIYLARPALAAGTRGGPAVIAIHGGSWRGGHRSDFAHWDRWFAAHGYAVFDIDYRTSPAPNYATAAEDVRSAIGWVRQNAVRYHVDADRIALLGRSAGAQLALIAGYTATDTSVRAVISLYGPTDLVWGYEHPPSPDVLNDCAVLRRYLGGPPQDAPAAYQAASPIEHVGPATPPTLLLHGSRDLLVTPDHAQRLSDRLAKMGIPYRTVFIPYATHGFDANINGWGSQIEQPILLDFLRRYLASRADVAQGRPLIAGIRQGGVESLPYAG